jgi:methionyl-tRNA formyltransferase
MKVAFFGTPEYCLPSLEALYKSRHKVVLVVTQPDRPVGRKKIVTPPPAKVLAQKLGIPVKQPERISRELEETFKDIEKPDIIVTCAFGQILKQNVLDFCKYGVINVHASILPKYRGASPINWAIINGEKTSGVTIMQTDIGIDTGDILLSKSLDILPNETAGELSARLSKIGADALLETLELIEKGKAKRIKQDNEKSTYYPMFKKTDGKIDFSKSPQEIVNFIRGMNPWPCAFAESNYGDIKVYSAHTEFGELRLDIVQSSGGKPMPYRDFLNGHKDLQLK